MRQPAYIEYDPRTTHHNKALIVLKCRMFDEFGDGNLLHVTNDKVILDAELWFILAVYQTK